MSDETVSQDAPTMASDPEAKPAAEPTATSVGVEAVAVEKAVLGSALSLPKGYTDDGQQPIAIHHAPDALEEMFQSIAGQALRLAHVDEAIKEVGLVIEGIRDHSASEFDSIKTALDKGSAHLLPTEDGQRAHLLLDRIDDIEKTAHASNAKQTALLVFSVIQFCAFIVGGYLFWQRLAELEQSIENIPPPPAAVVAAPKAPDLPPPQPVVDPVKPADKNDKNDKSKAKHHHR